MDRLAGFSERYCLEAIFRNAVRSLSAARTGRDGVNQSACAACGDLVWGMVGVVVTDQAWLDKMYQYSLNFTTQTKNIQPRMHQIKGKDGRAVSLPMRKNIAKSVQIRYDV